MSDLGQHIGTVARELLGEPNKRLSTASEMRFGTNGSLKIDLEKGTWFDHENENGGGVIDLLKRQGVDDARAWLDEHGLGEAKPNGVARERKEIEAMFDYVSETGELLYQTVRFRFLDAHGQPVITKDGKPKKTFLQRQPDGNGDWAWSLKGVRLVPYRLPELQEAIANDRPIFIPEGEKKVDRLRALGVDATCNPMGSGKWPESFAQFFAGADVILLPDNDEVGRKHADLVGSQLSGVAGRLRLLDLPNLPAKGDVIEWADAGGTAETLHDLVAKSRAWGNETALHFGAVWFVDAESRLQEPQWLVDDMLTAGDKSLVYGPSQSGKSFLATHIAMAIARGVDVFQRKTRRGGVVYIAGEGKKGFKKRLKAYRQEFGLTDELTLPFLLIPAAVDLYAEDGDVKSLIEDLQRIKPMMEAMGVTIELVVIDTLSACSPAANENASEDMSRILRHCDQIQEVTNGHVMIVHHKNAAGDRPRGHTSLYAAADNAIEVICDEAKNRTAKIAKLKDGEDGTSIGFRLQAVTIGERDDGKPITSCVVVPADAPAVRQGAKAITLTPQAKVALQALRYALAEYGEPAPGILELPMGLRVVNYRYWADRFARTSFDGDDAKPEALKKAIQRAGTQLLARNIIGRNNPYVWIVREPEVLIDLKGPNDHGLR